MFPESSQYPEFMDLTPQQAKNFIRDSKNWSLRSKMKEIITHVGGTVLDVACGNGIDADRFSAQLYTGVDISEPLILAAQDYCPSHKFMVMDATDLQFSDNSFDSVFCIGLLEHVRSFEDVIKIVREMLRVSSKKVFLGFHRPPAEVKTAIVQKKGHYGLWCNSNYYNKLEFFDKAKVRLVKEHVTTEFKGNKYAIWEIEDEA